MSVLKASNPNLFVVIIQKVFNFLMYLSSVSTTDEYGNEVRINLYKKTMDKLIEKNVGPDGEIPEWLQKVQMIFNWGEKFGILVEKAESGELADQLNDIIPFELSMTLINVDGLDQMLI